MANVVKFEDISDKIVQLKGQDVILDFDVAALYGVQTKEINQAVRNNPRKFPKGYVLETDREEVTRLRSKFLTANNPKSRVFPKAFKIIDDIFGEEMSTTGTETEFEINFAVLKVKHTIKRKKN